MQLTEIIVVIEIWCQRLKQRQRNVSVSVCVCVHESCKMILGKKSNKRRLGFRLFHHSGAPCRQTGSPSLYTESTRNAVRSFACLWVWWEKQKTETTTATSHPRRRRRRRLHPPPLLSSLCCNFPVTISGDQRAKVVRILLNVVVVVLSVQLLWALLWGNPSPPLALSLSLSLSFLPLLLQANSSAECGR